MHLSAGRSHRHAKTQQLPLYLKRLAAPQAWSISLHQQLATMLAILSFALSLIPLSLAAPQWQGGQGGPASSSECSAAHTGYSDFTGVHQYANVDYSDWAEGGVDEYPILFCNTSETATLRRALYEAEVLAAHARDHIHRWGNSSSYYRKYFGLAGTAEPAGWYDKIVNGDKTGVIIRCDDPDGVCAAEPGKHFYSCGAIDRRLTSSRMGRLLAWNKRLRPEQHLSAIVQRALGPRFHVHARIHSCGMDIRPVLGLRPAPPSFSYDQDR